MSLQKSFYDFCLSNKIKIQDSMFSKLSYIFVPSLFVVSGVCMVLHPMYQKEQSFSQLRYATANVRTLSKQSQTTTDLPTPALTFLNEMMPQFKGAKNSKNLNLLQWVTAPRYKDEIVDVATPTYDSSTDGVDLKDQNVLSFCGEKVPLDNSTVNAKFLSELNKNKKGSHGLMRLLQLSTRYKSEILEILQANGLHPDIYYVAVAESGLGNVTSPRGAKGFWQFMPGAAIESGLEISATVDERLHPIKATLAACNYFKASNKVLHDWTLSAAAYNMGTRGVTNAIAKQGTRNYYNLDLNSETGNYVYRIVALKALLENPSKYGIKVNSKERVGAIPYYIVKVNHDIGSLATFAKEHNSNLKELKLMNPWLISDHLVAQPGKTYEIQFPKVSDLNLDELAVR